ncbi:type II toxin-antitoxin system RelE/ParE family toxin [Rhodopseudomonas palustris]|uniref:type II toxin-antitoxin system RelE/ParE family toxin n=1 Tax=Rhodopseudomonas palustris TaxID=1076 RepID=UPI001F322365|nr:type II toxin-antitoxin system RelE/ParE family toxin [Rhodopseudomonas palustris]
MIARIASAPASAPRVTQRPDIRSAAVVRYPFRVFYRVQESKIEILHIRHTARAPMQQSD